MGRGDHIYVWRSEAGVVRFQHHGIDCGNDTVIHYTKVENERSFVVERTSLANFASGGEIFYREYKLASMTHEIVQRAESKLGEKLYNLFANNCEHFATWCMTGNFQSEQIKQGTAGAVSVTGAGLGSIGATVASRVAADIAFKNLGPIAKTAVNLGLRSAPAVSGTAAMGIVAISVAPGLVAQLALNQALADDDSLPDAERRARGVGRMAAGLGVVTGFGAAFIVAAPVAAAIGAVAPVIGGYGLYYLNKPKDKGYKK